MDIYIIAAILFILSIVGARIINEKGLKFLNTEEKGMLVQAFLDLSKYQLIFLVLIIGLYFLLVKLFPTDIDLLLVGYFSIMILFMVIHAFIISKKLHSYSIPKTYTRYYILSTLVKTGGMIVSMALIFYNTKQF